MWTKRDIIQKAYGELGLGSDPLDIPAGEMQDAMHALDALMFRWATLGIVFDPAYPQPATMRGGDLDDTSNVPLGANEAVYLNLALRLAPSFGKTPSPDTKKDARRAYSDLLGSFTEGAERQTFGLVSPTSTAGLLSSTSLPSQSYAANASITLTGGNNGLLSRLIELYPVSEYDRAAIVGYDHNRDIAWAISSHSKNIVDDAVHNALEFKTRGLNLKSAITRMSIGYGTDLVPIDLNEIDSLNLLANETPFLWVRANDADDEVITVHPTTNQTGYVSFSNRVLFGYSEPNGMGEIRASTGKGFRLYTNGSSLFHVSFDANGLTRFNGPVRKDLKTFSQLPAAAPGNLGDEYTVTDATAGEANTFRGAITLGGGSEVAPVYSDGSAWRFG